MCIFKNQFLRSFYFLPVMLLVIIFTGCSNWSSQTDKALSLAGNNKAELKKVLRHYEAAGDEQKLAAAEFLISQMPGHGYVTAALYDDDGNEVPYDCTDYDNFKQAIAAIDKLEEEHGKLKSKRKHFIKDIDTVTGDYLIENIDIAFETWKQNRWTKEMSFESFCEHILPYRCSNEPVNRWRKSCVERYKDLPDKMTDPGDIEEAVKLIQKDVHKWVKFDTLYYLHPTDQGFDDMQKTGKGRCEDISNMISYAMRANGIAVASDYTPAWANRDNNHAWNALLDSEGKGNAGLGNIAAKIYRKTFSDQKDAIVFRKKKKEGIPRWLSGKNFVDVTDQYFKTCDVTIQLNEEKPDNVSFAYLCVFNGGKWVPICSGDINSKQATFPKINRSIMYLPVYYYDKEIHPAADPFILTREGEVVLLNGISDNSQKVKIEITTLKPATDDDDTRIEIPQIVIKPNKAYEMFYWNGQWESLGTKSTPEQSVFFDNLPPNRLYWMVEDKSKKLERIFTISNGKQLLW